MNVFHVICLMSALNSAADSGEYEEVGVEEIRRHIEQGDLVSYLEVRLARGPHTAAFEILAGCEVELTARLQQLLPVFQGRFEQKLGICRNGLCLLIALLIQIVQDHVLRKVAYNPSAAEEIIPVPRRTWNLRPV